METKICQHWGSMQGEVTLQLKCSLSMAQPKYLIQSYPEPCDSLQVVQEVRDQFSLTLGKHRVLLPGLIGLLVSKRLQASCSTCICGLSVVVH